MIRNRFARVITLLLAAALANVGGCKDKGNTDAAARVHTVPAGTPLKLAFVTNNANDFWKIAEAGCKKYEQETGVHIDFKMPEGGSVAEQKQILENLLSQGYDGIAMSVIAPADETAEIDAASTKTNILCHDSDAPNSKRLLFIGTNNFAAGQALGQEIVKLLPAGGKIAVFVGTFSADNAQQRLAGVQDAIKGHNIEIIAKKEDNTDHGKARANVENVLTVFPEVNLLCGLWAYNGPAMVSAVEAAGKKGKVQIASFDEDQGTLDGIKDGFVACTVVQKPFQFGYQAAKWMHDLAYGGETKLPANPIIDTGIEVINAANVADFSAKLAAMKSGH